MKKQPLLFPVWIICGSIDHRRKLAKLNEAICRPSRRRTKWLKYPVLPHDATNSCLPCGGPRSLRAIRQALRKSFKRRLTPELAQSVGDNIFPSHIYALLVLAPGFNLVTNLLPARPLETGFAETTLVTNVGPTTDIRGPLQQKSIIDSGGRHSTQSRASASSSHSTTILKGTERFTRNSGIVSSWRDELLCTSKLA